MHTTVAGRGQHELDATLGKYKNVDQWIRILFCSRGFEPAETGPQAMSTDKLDGV